MSDGVPVTAGSGTTIATDEIAGSHYQRVKVTFGVDGVATDASAADPLPVTLPGSVAVTGTFYQATQPVSGTVTANAGTGTFAVSGTFWQATQPVSIAASVAVTGPLTDTQLRATAVPVSGTFYQATQPVSLATNTPTIAAGTAIIGKVGIDQTTPGTTNLVALAANQTVNNALINGVAPLMGNGVTGTGSQRVTIASDNTAFSVNATLQTGANVIGALTANQSVNNAQIGGVSVSTGNGVVGTGVQRVAIASDNSAVPTSAAAGEYARLAATTTSLLLSAAATTNATSVKGSAGAVKGIQGYNARTTACYLKIYNKATSPTVGTDTPVKTLYLPAAASFAFDFPSGVTFATGIAYALTGAAATADTTALAAGDVVCLNVDYI